MEQLTFKFNSKPASATNFGLSVGVVNSGNVEILILDNGLANEATFSIITTIKGFSSTWQAVVADFAAKYQVGGVHFLLNDSGAIASVVSLRLRQAYEVFTQAQAKKHQENSHYLELNARERILAIVDENSFKEWLGPQQQIVSPHLAQLDLPCSFDDGVIIGQAKFNHELIYIAAQNFAFMGGAVGEVNGAKLTGLCLKALHNKPQAVIFLLDSGGVRLQEANAGEIAISEIIAVIMQLRMAKIPTLGVIAGRNGAFGGVGIIAQCLDNIILTENARTGVSGPEVIETVMGTLEYDSADRGLVWRTCGGRHRVLMEDGHYAKKDIASIKAMLNQLLTSYQPLTYANLLAENQMLLKRIKDNIDCQDGSDIWQKKGYANAINIPNLSDLDFLKLIK